MHSVIWPEWETWVPGVLCGPTGSEARYRIWATLEVSLRQTLRLLTDDLVIKNVTLLSESTDIYSKEE